MERMSIGNRLDEAMKEAGFASQSALARASSVPQPTINRILSGITPRGPETETVRRLAQTCGVSFTWLNEGIGPRQRLANEDSTLRPEVLALAEKLTRLPAEKLAALSVLLDLDAQ